MIQLSLPSFEGDSPKVLCLGAHSDDIEIGCGGTILRLIDQFPGIRFHWAVFSAIGVRRQEAEKAAQLFAGPRIERLLLKEYPDGFMPYVGGEVKAAFEEIKKQISPDLIFTHQSSDAHQDHRLLSELTWNTFRHHLIFEYEIPKYDGDMGRPSVFAPLGEETCRTKLRYIMESFVSQHGKNWFEESTFQGLMRIRGMECNAPSGFAEAFYCRKIVI